MATSAPIQVAGLSHSFGKGALQKQVLFDITTEIPKGEIVIVTDLGCTGINDAVATPTTASRIIKTAVRQTGQVGGA